MPSLTASLTWACGPSITETGSPGITRNARNASVAAPHSTEMADAAIPAIRMRRGFTTGSADRDLAEPRATVQVVLEAGDRVIGCGDQRRAVERHDRSVLRVPLLQLLIDRGALIDIAGADALLEQRVDLRVGHLRGVLEALAVQVTAQQVAVHARESPVGEVEGLRDVLLVVGARLEHLPHDLEADVGEVGLDGVAECGVVVGHRSVGDPAHRETFTVLHADAVAVALDPSGLVEQCTRGVLVEGPTVFYRGVVHQRRGAEDAPRPRELSEEDLLDGCVDVDPSRERLAHLLIGE